MGQFGGVTLISAQKCPDTSLVKEGSEMMLVKLMKKGSRKREIDKLSEKVFGCWRDNLIGSVYSLSDVVRGCPSIRGLVWGSLELSSVFSVSLGAYSMKSQNYGLGDILSKGFQVYQGFSLGKLECSQGVITGESLALSVGVLVFGTMWANGEDMTCDNTVGV
ncbi:hypothetical protein Tco_1413379 [Tanacetum coccineum]